MSMLYLSLSSINPFVRGKNYLTVPQIALKKVLFSFNSISNCTFNHVNVAVLQMIDRREMVSCEGKIQSAFSTFHSRVNTSALHVVLLRGSLTFSVQTQRSIIDVCILVLVTTK